MALPKEVSKYFDDVLKNKEVIRDMYLTNVSAYEEKIKKNAEVIERLKDELRQVKLENELEENKLKSDYNSSMDELKKYQINFKLLMKTYQQYEQLIKERQEQINTLQEKLIFVDQDLHSKKFKLESSEAQVQELEYQNKNLQATVEEKSNQLKHKRIKDSYSNQIKYNSGYSTLSANTYIQDNHYNRNMTIEKPLVVQESKNSVMTDMDINTKKNKCVVF